MGKSAKVTTEDWAMECLETLKKTYTTEVLIHLCGMFYVAFDMDWETYERIADSFGYKLSVAIRAIPENRRRKIMFTETQNIIQEHKDLQMIMFCEFADLFLENKISDTILKKYLLIIGYGLTEEFDAMSDEEKKEMFATISSRMIKILKGEDTVFEEENV